MRAGEEIAPALSKYAHAVIFVVKTNDPCPKEGKYKETLQKIRDHFREDGNNNIHQNSSFRPLIAKILLDDHYGGGLIRRNGLIARVLARVNALCSWTRHFSLSVPLSPSRNINGYLRI